VKAYRCAACVARSLEEAAAPTQRGTDLESGSQGRPPRPRRLACRSSLASHCGGHLSSSCNAGTRVPMPRRARRCALRIRAASPRIDERNRAARVSADGAGPRHHDHPELRRAGKRRGQGAEQLEPARPAWRCDVDLHHPPPADRRADRELEPPGCTPAEPGPILIRPRYFLCTLHLLALCPSNQECVPKAHPRALAWLIGALTAHGELHHPWRGANARARFSSATSAHSGALSLACLMPAAYPPGSLRARVFSPRPRAGCASTRTAPGRRRALLALLRHRRACSTLTSAIRIRPFPVRGDARLPLRLLRRRRSGCGRAGWRRARGSLRRARFLAEGP
jgi:hypothetical protein